MALRWVKSNKKISYKQLRKTAGHRQISESLLPHDCLPVDTPGQPDERRFPDGHFPGKTFPGWSFSRMRQFRMINLQAHT